MQSLCRKTAERPSKTAGRNLTRNRAEAAQEFFAEHVQTLEVRTWGEGDYVGSCKHLKGMDVKGERTSRSQHTRICDEEGSALGDIQ